jgi:hypothetical protein
MARSEIRKGFAASRMPVLKLQHDCAEDLADYRAAAEPSIWRALPDTGGRRPRPVR